MEKSPALFVAFCLLTRNVDTGLILTWAVISLGQCWFFPHFSERLQAFNLRTTLAAHIYAPVTAKESSVLFGLRSPDIYSVQIRGVTVHVFFPNRSVQDVWLWCTLVPKIVKL